MTDAERLFWSKVRRKQLNGHQFYRQKNIGEFIVDFYCPSARLIVELDGGQHFLPEGIKGDKTRDEYLRSVGLNVLRFSDRDVLIDTESVLETVFKFINASPKKK